MTLNVISSTTAAMTSSSPPSPAAMPLASSSLSPQYSLQKGRYTSTLKIGDWTINTTKKPILNGKEIDTAEKSLNFPLPEMTFGNNSLILIHQPEGCGDDEILEIRFVTLEILSQVAVGDDWEVRVGGGVLVSMAEEWGKNRPKSSAFLPDMPLPSKPVRPHDWTYSSTSPGVVVGSSSISPSTTRSIPMKLLSRQDPILDRIIFYDDVPLFEDELHDNGESILNVRIRVMPHSFFILARHFLRVDNVLFRIFDIRIYHAFGSGEVIREVTGMEAGYEEVKAKLESPSDLSPLTSSNFVYQAMTSLLSESQSGGQQSSPNQNTSRPSVVHRPSSRLRTGKPWPGLGSRVEVLKLSGKSVDGAVEGLDKLGL